MKHQLTASTLFLSPPGDILSTTIGPMRAEFIRLMETPEVRDGKWKTLELNLAEARMVDSAGLNFLVTLIKAARHRGAAVRALVKSRTVHRTFVFTRLDTQVELVFQDGTATDSAGAAA
jgi:ABC-type transporter Mla MlaB component